jgi:predicted Fe-S protein YdhL (DUF1289 family)
MPPPATAAAPAVIPASIASPCVSICKMDTASGLCTGCQRTIDEIASWSRYSDAEKQAVWLRIGERRARCQG